MKKLLLGLLITIFLTFNISVFADENINVLVIDDKRCVDCYTDAIINQLKGISILSDSNFKISDFSNEGISEYLNDNNITKLPAVIFESNNIDSQIDNYLIEIPSGEYSLQIGAKFDPFIERSDRGYKIIDDEKLKNIKKNSFIKGNLSAQITIIEYSDLECPYCTKLHNDGTIENLEKNYGNNLNVIFNHFPLSLHSNAQIGGEILECAGKEKFGKLFYTLVDKSFSEKDSSKEFLIKEAVKLGSNEKTLRKCIEEGKYTEKVKNQMKVGSEVFGVTGTPGVVIINNKTGEYTLVLGSYPYSHFKAIIDKLVLPKTNNYSKLAIISKANLNKKSKQKKYIEKIDLIVERLSEKKLEKLYSKLNKINRKTKSIRRYGDFFDYFEAKIALKLGIK